MNVLLSCFLFGSLISGIRCHEIETKVCTLHHGEQCSQLARGGELACEPNFHRVDCILNINNGVSHLGLVKPEESLLAAPLTSDNVVVIGELYKPSGKPYQTVVVVKKDFAGGLENLRGKKYCHPGFKYNFLVTKLVLEELENTILPDNEVCNNDGKSLVEKHIQALSKHFTSACRPGLWTQDIVLDKELKNKYPNLCELCETEKCEVDYKNPMNDSLGCLLEKDADVALSTITYAKLLDASKPGEFKLLCKNGTTTDINQPCFWTSQLRDLIIAHKDKAKSLQDLLKKYFVKNNNLPEEERHTYERMKSYLYLVMSIDPHSVVKLTENIQPLSSYVSERRTIYTVKDITTCGVTMRWCTRNEIEQEKCEWFAQASLNQGILPTVQCIQSTYDEELSCLKDVKSKKSDIFTVSTNSAYTAAKYDLVNIGNPETDTRYVYSIELVLAENNPAKGISDLRNKRACFPEFGGKEFMAFVKYLQKNGLVEKDYDFGKSLDEFVDESCTPGILGSDTTEIENKMKFCMKCMPLYNNLTAKYCNADYKNKYYGNYGALQCLADGNGDFAVVTTIDVANNGDKLKKVLCRNNTVVKEVSLKDEECALSVIPTSEIVARYNDPKILDYVLALREYEVVFGENLEKPFHLFEVFNKTKDLLFKDSTPGIRFSSTNVYIDNLKKLTADFDRRYDTIPVGIPVTTSQPGSAMNTKPLCTIVIIFTFSILILRQAYC